MHPYVLKICKGIWSATPWRSLRKIYLDLFMVIVRGQKVIRQVEGVTFDLDLSENIDMCLLLERFERDVVEAIERYCRSGWRVLDIGANIGAHTLRLGKSVGLQGTVYAFEPTDYAHRKLLRNISLNQTPQIMCFKQALGTENKVVEAVNIRSSWQTNGTNKTGPSKVEFIRLDDWAKHHGVTHVDMIKIDVDGNEFPVFDGGRKVLASCRPLIIMEVGTWHFAEPTANALAILRDLGYRFWDLKTMQEYSGLQEIRDQLPREDKTMAFSINVLAAPEPPLTIGSFSLVNR